ncbi:unnamed protein product [Rotaria socialis]|uniref:Uncharacterized protein n=1 Tax=Rotaria socialis TaxID=392032 RepID=A0A821DCW2_9BILA|nr:unnamed protein product [Rotaria socialis]
MTNNIALNTEKSPLLGHQLLTDENNSVRHILQNKEEKPYLSYFKLSSDDNRNINLTNFQDPFFYEQPLDFNYHRLMPAVILSENEIGFRQYYKENSLSSHRNGIERSESISRKHMKPMKTNQKIIKRKEIKKKRSVENENRKNCKNKNAHRNYFKQYEHEVMFSKAKKIQQELLSKRKKKLSKQHIRSKKKSILKGNTSRTSNQKKSSRQSLTSTFKRSRSLTQSKAGKKRSKNALRSNANRALSNFRKISNKVKDETSLLTLNPNLRLNNHQMMKIESLKSKKTKQKIPICSKLNKKLSKTVRHYRKSQCGRYKTQSSQCKSKTSRNKILKLVLHNYKKKAAVSATPSHVTSLNVLVTTAPNNRNDRNNVKFIEMKISPSLSTLKNSLNENISSISTIMPLTKNNVQLTSKNNNRRACKNKHTRNILGSTQSERRLMTITGTGMILRSKNILRNGLNLMQRKN